MSRPNIQNIPTAILWLMALAGGPAPPVTVLGSGRAALANTRAQTIAYGSTLSAVPDCVFCIVELPNGGGTSVFCNPIVGDYTTTQFQLQLSAPPGDTNHNVIWFAVTF